MRTNAQPSPPPPRPVPTSFHLLTKPTGAICNLDCEYCFFLSKEELYPGSTFRMTTETLETYVRQLLEAHRQADSVTVAWQGGEPTMMGLDFYRRAMDLVDRHARPGQAVTHTIQTNATLLDDEWATFFAEHGFLVGVSVDGPREMHDAYRVDKGGKPSFDRVVAGLRTLQRHGVEWNALTTVHAANHQHGLEVYRFLRDELGATFMQFIPVVERSHAPDGPPVVPYSVPADGYGQFLVEVFEEWVRHDVGDVFVQMFDVALAQWVGAPPSLCVHAETCGTALALEHTGDLYSCDHFVDPAFLLGNINDRPLLELVSSPQQIAFGRAKRDALPRQCLECSVRFACHGGCPKDRFISDKYGQPALNYLCPSYTRFFTHIDERMRQMAMLLRGGRDASRIRRLVLIDDERRDPSSPCPCGRAWAFADCHGSARAG
ncbi:MAG: anaerobic sulfatase maturase [Jiangellales bacterium]